MVCTTIQMSCLATYMRSRAALSLAAHESSRKQGCSWVRACNTHQGDAAEMFIPLLQWKLLQVLGLLFRRTVRAPPVIPSPPPRFCSSNVKTGWSRPLLLAYHDIRSSLTASWALTPGSRAKRVVCWLQANLIHGFTQLCGTETGCGFPSYHDEPLNFAVVGPCQCHGCIPIYMGRNQACDQGCGCGTLVTGGQHTAI
ncbi:hypothetical protein BC827DRAFT_1194146 [Russula dissimulans]|nr:hypothetical protein BC827DRAFT_1194146 [Russula dissimulans]